MKLWFERGAWASTRGRKALEKISPESVGRIVVIRHAALGDMILTRPFLVEAKKYFPNAEIVLSIVSNYSYGVPHDLVDRVHVIQGSDQPQAGLRAWLTRARELGEADILFDLADTTRSRYLTWLSDAKIKIGFPYRWYLRNLLFDAAVFRSDFVFEAEAMLDTLKLLGANPKTPIQFNWPQHSQHGAVRSLAKRIVYFPFASVRAKCWPKEYFSQLISVLATELPIGKDEGPADFMNLAENYRNVECQPVLNLDLTIQLLGNSNLVISNDTGVRNLAISVDTPTLGIFFSTVPHRYWPRGSGHHKAVFLPDGEIPTVEQVAAEARQLLGKADIWVEKIRC